MAGERCGYPRCGHAAHKGPCQRRYRPAAGQRATRCMPFDDGHGLTGITCGRPQCTCPWRTCACGAKVAVAQCEDDRESEETIDRGVYDRGTLAVRVLADGSLMARPVPAKGELRPGEWRGTDHDTHCPKAKQRGVTCVTDDTGNLVELTK